MPDIYEVIKKEHDEHREVLDKLDKTEGDSEERRELYARLKKQVDAHTAAEEQTFYATLMSFEDGQDKARHSVAEHEEADEMIEELDEIEMSTGGWLTKFRSLKDALEHHMEEEEDEVFRRARKLISKEKAEELGPEFLARKEDKLKAA